MVYLASKRLDVRFAGERESRRSWASDDLLFDIVVDEGFVGEFVLLRCFSDF